MKITDLPELSVADLALDDVVVVDHDTGNGIETRKFRVGKALADKLDKSGGEMTDYIRFGTHTAGLSWTLNNGDRMEWRPYVGGDRDVFQLVRVPGDGSMPQGYGILNVDIADGNERIYASLNEKRDGYFPLSSIQSMAITGTLASVSGQGTMFSYTLRDGYKVANITLETVGWVGAVYATAITNTSFQVYCAAVQSAPVVSGAYKTIAHISMYKTFG
jgi:hypothetical protein